MLLWILGYMHLFESVYVFFDIYPGMEFLGHIVFYLQGFFEKATFCFLQWLHQFTFPPIVNTGSFFSTSLPVFIICVLFDDGHSDRCEVVFHSGFDLQFQHDYWCCVSSGVCWPSACPLWKYTCSFLLPIFKLGCRILIPRQSYHLLTFSPIQ